jgi:sensor domain CHASE-containing protein
VTEHLMTTLGSLPAPALSALIAGGAGLLVIVSVLSINRRQRRLLQRVEERLTHLHAGLSLLTNTTEDGLRGVALEVARLAGAAETKPKAVASARQRIASAAGHGRSVQDIAANEQVSEGEVLLHLLLDKLRPEAGNAEVC